MTRLEHMYKDLGITMQNSYYIHGEYDWVIIFTAKDVRSAKLFSDSLVGRFSDTTKRMQLSQVLFTLREQFILNPEPMKMKDFL